MTSFYRKEIDFLRALAVIFVILYHYFPNILNKGYLGVDLFFVISGFLISFQIYDQTIKKEFSLKNFYVRRIKRILPATLFTLFVVFLISIYLLTDTDFYYFLKSLVYSLFFSSNFFFWQDGGYFGPNDELKPLLHFWSLAIEEQFYIIFPCIFLIFIKFLKNKNILFFIIFLITSLSLILNVALINLGGSNPAFFLLPTRIWNLSFGVMAMLMFVNRKEVHSNIEATFFFCLIIVGVFYEIPNLPTNFLIVFSSFMLLRKKLPKNFIFKNFVENKYFNYLGLISFSLYLWHWPILVFFKYYFVYDVNIWFKILSLLIMFLLSIFSYHIIELTFRYKLNFKKLILIISLVYLFFISAFFFINNLKNNSKYEINSPNFIASASLTNFKCKTTNYILYDKLRGCLINKHGINDYDLALVGNSHAQMYVPSILPFLKKKSQKGMLLPMTGCLPTLTINISEDCLKTSNKYFKKYAEDNKITNIIIATTWWHDQLYDGEKFVNDTEHILLARSLLQLVNKLNSLGKIVYLVGPIQVPLYELPQDLSRLLKFNHINKNQLINKLKVDKTTYEKNYGKINKLLSKELNLNFIDLSKEQCDDKYCYYGNNEGIFFADGSHLSNYAANLFSKSFKNIFK